MVECHIGERNGAWVESPIKEYTYLYHKYVVEKMTLRDIAQREGVALRTVARWMKHHDIPRRATSDYPKPKGAESPGWKGALVCQFCGGERSFGSERCRECRTKFLRASPDNVPAYRGIADVTTDIRRYTQEIWRPRIFERDGYRCRECGDAAGGNLHAHHIIPFHVIRDQLLLEHATDFDLSVAEGRRALIDLAKADARINDLDNGITLCDACHKGEHDRIQSNLEDLLYTYSATVVSIVDPDTIACDIDLGFNIVLRQDVRLYGVNTPERANDTTKAIFAQGLALVDALCPPGRTVVLRTYKAEKYGRWLAIVVLDNVWLNRALVKTGLAQEYLL